MDYTITLVLAIALILKYILFDNDVDKQMNALLEKERNKDVIHSENTTYCQPMKYDMPEIPMKKDSVSFVEPIPPQETKRKGTGR